MSTAIPSPEPMPDDVERCLIEIEQHLAEKAPAAEPVETRRVRDLRAQVNEAHQLLALQLDQAPLLVDTPKVRKRRKQAAEAAQLHTLAQDPATRAWQAARMRRLLTVVGLVALALALSWSTAGVHAFAAEGAPAWSPGWVFAWFVEPFLSLALLLVVGARAYLGTRGQPLDHPTLVKIEYLFLGLTLAMNAWPYLPGIADEFSPAALVLHILGPIVAVAVVTALPIILAAFTGIDHGPLTGGLTGPAYRQNVPATGSVSQGVTDPRTVHLVTRARRLIVTGQLPAEPSANRLREALQCGMDTAREVRDALRVNPDHTTPGE